MRIGSMKRDTKPTRIGIAGLDDFPHGYRVISIVAIRVMV
jgi:hypothetical protein